MPVKFNEEMQMYIDIDGIKHKLGKLEDVEITSAFPDADDDYKLFYENKFGEFTCFWIDTNSKAWKREQRMMYRGTNNWRKMHGLPLRRYSK